MDCQTFTKLWLDVSICPKQRFWPRPDVEFGVQGDVITARGLHWSRIHDAVNWLRDHTANALSDLTGIGADGRIFWHDEDKPPLRIVRVTPEEYRRENGIM